MTPGSGADPTPEVDPTPKLVECKGRGCTREALIEGYCGQHQNLRYQKGKG